jgi:hypothetical protein
MSIKTTISQQWRMKASTPTPHVFTMTRCSKQCGTNASWQRERWGNTMTDHGEVPAGNGEEGEGERGEKRGGGTAWWGES